MGHLNGILARVGGNLDNNFQKSQMPGELPGGGGGILKLRFDRFISPLFCFLFLFFVLCLFVCFFLFNNPISSSICKLPIRSQIYNCTFKNTNKVSIIIIIITDFI